MVENLLNKKNVKRVKEFINLFNKKIKIIELNKTARTALDAANSLQVDVGSIVKSLVFQIKNDKKYILCLISGDKRVSVEKLSKNVNLKIVTAKAIDVKKVTGFSIGGIPPFAHKIKLITYIDESLLRFHDLYAAAGHPHCVFKIKYEELIKLTNAEVGDFSN
ncbi:MAG: prolyl-tRNA editing protein [Pelagibacteraceae bacterium]|nr:prolyl-tRNA editing protein [Pelagibacteraceae bacterium]|tara:strand:+ start:118 stop:606 length:489 start_codon:yes stop_codon:yes gene_type:complete